jgi:hypothetical protein
MKKTIFLSFLVLVIGLVFFSCSTTGLKGSYMVTGTARTPTNPTEVKIYYTPPAEYETIGVVTVQATGLRGLSGGQMPVFQEMQKQAALMGANGLLVPATSDWIHTGQAIFVTKE